MKDESEGGSGGGIRTSNCITALCSDPTMIPAQNVRGKEYSGEGRDGCRRRLGQDSLRLLPLVPRHHHLQSFSSNKSPASPPTLKALAAR
ncbi:hypothetical protein E2C01_055650 [Portunus trituberculatus]|uniref:Uncharacterized protein n=1 Tax=Portunus trituberculatus TaxID=210409 RepID=A0A5B7GVC8_PORTR|nr:hypothetical protein [Portunus trituberculatus]